MGLRLARPISRASRLCGAPAQLSRLGRLWRPMAAAERLPGLAHLDRRYHRRGALARPAGHRRSEPDGDRRLVLWRLCGAAGRGRPSPTCSRRSSRSRRSPTCSRLKDDSATVHQRAQRRRICRQRSAYRRRLAAAPRRRGSRRRCCCSTATATSTCWSGHSRRMHDALRDAGRPSELVVFPRLEHDLADGEARRRMLDRIRTFLAGHMGAATDAQ